MAQKCCRGWTITIFEFNLALLDYNAIIQSYNLIVNCQFIFKAGIETAAIASHVPKSTHKDFLSLLCLEVARVKN